MNYLLDTNHWIYLQQGHPGILARLQSLSDEAFLYMPVVAQAELLVGIALSSGKRRRRELEKLYEQVLDEVTNILPITSNVAQHYAKIFIALRRKGKPIPTNDLWIAAIASAHKLILVSNDEHFQFVAGLSVENWT